MIHARKKGLQFCIFFHIRWSSVCLYERRTNLHLYWIRCTLAIIIINDHCLSNNSTNLVIYVFLNYCSFRVSRHKEYKSWYADFDPSLYFLVGLTCSLQRSSIKKSFLKNFATLSKKRLQHRCFPSNFTKFLRTPFVKNICERLRLNDVVMSGLILQVTTCIFWISIRNGHVKPLILHHGVTYR